MVSQTAAQIRGHRHWGGGDTTHCLRPPFERFLKSGTTIYNSETPDTAGAKIEKKKKKKKNTDN